MNLRQALAGMLQIFSVFVFFGAGFFFTCLPFSPHLRIFLADTLRDRPDLYTWTGLGFFAMAFLLVFGFYAASRGRYLLLRMGGSLVRVDAKILYKSIGFLMEKQFSSAIRLNDVEIIRGKHLELRVLVDPMEKKEKEQLLLEVEKQLARHLSERFGYHSKFTLQVQTV